MIYVLYGVSGAGKKSVCKCVVDNFGLRVIDKYTTKSITDSSKLRVDDRGNNRFRDDNFLISLPNEKVQARRGQDYIYDRYKPDGSGTVSYLIKKSDISQALISGENYLLVCSDGETLNKIKDFVGDNDWDQKFRKILVVGATKNNSHWTDADNQEIYDALKKDPKQFFGIIHNKYCDNGYGDEVIERISKQWTYITGMVPVSKKIFFIKPYVSRYIDNTEDLSIVCGKEYDSLENEIAAVLDGHDISYSIESILVHSPKARTYKINDEYSDKREDFIFQEINRLISNVDSEFCAEIVDNSLNAQKELIVENIIKQLKSAGLIIVDLSHHRHNCYYELAMARALKKDVIVIIDKAEASRVPFDEDQRNRFKYEIQYDEDDLAYSGQGIQIATGIKFCDAISGNKEFITVIKEFITKAKKMYQIKWKQ